MLDPVWLNESIRPRGLNMVVSDDQQDEAETEVGGIKIVGTERRFYRATVEGKIRGGEFKQCEIRFSLPIAREGMFMVGGLRRYIIPQGIIDVEAYDLNRAPSYYFRSRTQILVNALIGMFDLAFTDFFMSGNPPTDSDIQGRIDSWFKASDETREVPPNRIGLDSMKEMVLLGVPNEGLDLTNRHFPKDLLGVIDPASTPAGERVNKAYRLVRGADISDGQLKPGNSIFCSTIEKHHLPVCLSPRRTHLVRSAYENAVPVDAWEPPLVGNPGLKGRHLLTALMNLRTYAGDDAIVMSQTAAVKLRATREVQEDFYVLGSLHMHVKEGDEILPKQALGESIDPITQQPEVFYAKKIKGPAKIIKITAIRSSYFNIPAKRLKVTCAVTADAASGDKVITRAAIKGVIRVLPDEQMPCLPDGRLVEAIISPESVVNRRALSFYWEGMANNLLLSLPEDQRVGVVRPDHFDPRPTFPELVEAGWGEGIKLTYHGEELPEETYVAPIYFIRLDKIAREIVSCHTGDASLNGMQLPIDQASQSGQKRDFAKGAALKARGMDKILDKLVRDNIKGRFALTELSQVIKGPKVASPVSEEVEAPTDVISV